MKSTSSLKNNLKEMRTRLGLSQQELAELSGVSRQTIGGAEAGSVAPSATIALNLARALGCRVEDLFWLDEDLPEIRAQPALDLSPGSELRVALARIGGRWIAHSLQGEHSFRTEWIPADGRGRWKKGQATMGVKPLDEPGSLERTVVLAGCTPALSLWARAAERCNPGLRVHWTFSNSVKALGQLEAGEVHAAGVHLYDPGRDESNVPFIRRLLPNRNLVLINLGFWEEGLLVKKSNPLNLKSAADLSGKGVRIVNREEGAGARFLLELLLREEGIPTATVRGFEDTVTDHLEVARAVASGRADAGVSVASIASIFNLGFVPLRQVRYDIALYRDYLDEPPVRQLLNTLSHRWIKQQLATLGGYDTRQTGETVARLEAAGPGDA